MVFPPTRKVCMSLLHVVHGQSVTSAGAEVVSLKVIAMESIVLSSSISINCRTLVKVDAPGLYEWRKDAAQYTTVHGMEKQLTIV